MTCCSLVSNARTRYTTLLAFRKVTHIAFINTYIQKIQMLFATREKLSGQENNSQVLSHKNTMKIS